MKGSTKKKIAFVCPYPFDIAPGQRFRYEQYLKLLEERGYAYTLFSFLNFRTSSILYKKGAVLQKTWGIVRGFLIRIVHLFKIRKYEYVFLFREAAPIGPPVFEWIISRVMKKKIIYDFDDAIWLPVISDQNKMALKLKWPQKVGLICKWSYKVSCGNHYLCHYATQFNPKVVYNPTTIDTVNYHNRKKDQQTSPVVIGWTGSHSTLKYLQEVLPALQKLEKKYEFTFLVIANEKPEIPLKSFVFKKWNKDTEIEDLLSFNIGIMPLPDDEWTKGKCGFKALQYMSIGVPAVVSSVGVNTEIIQDGSNGFVCSTQEEWFEKLSMLLKDAALRSRLGEAGIQTVRERYSVLSNRDNFLSVFN